MFSGSFMDMLDTNDPLIVLANNFPWSKIESELSQHYSGAYADLSRTLSRFIVGHSAEINSDT
jgi:DNA-binding transcriptional regulator/RsmH inhibitor MraZ